MIKKQLTNLSAICVLAVSSSAAMAHLNIAQENVFSVGENGREYLEGKSAFINMNISHDCTDSDGNHHATTDIVVILPNSQGLSSNFYTANREGDIFGANGVMGTKARVSGSWKSIKAVKGAISEYYSHGAKTEDVRAVKWLRGYVDNYHYDNNEIKTGFPKIAPESCVGTLRVEIPAVQYCTDGYVTAWIGTEGSTRFPADSEKLRLEESYEPYLNVVRDVDNNPYPASCDTDGDGEPNPLTETVRPSDADIDLYGGREL